MNVSAGFGAHKDAPLVEDRPAFLDVRGLCAGYPKSEKRILENISFFLDPGELLCLLGPNGSGKSTLIKTICGILPPKSGDIFCGGVPMRDLSSKERAKKLGVVLTNRVSPGYFTVSELVGLGRYPHTSWTGTFSQKDMKAVEEALFLVGAGNLKDRLGAELSDGERQKVMIARALAQEPEILVLDEPTAFLDIPRRLEIFRLLKRLAHDNNKAVLLSTHDLDLALSSADRILVIDSRGGAVSGAPEDLVLQGCLEKHFSVPGIVFNPVSGKFSLPGPVRGRAVVAGSGTRAFWTGKALERAGFYPEPEEARQEGAGESDAEGMADTEAQKVLRVTVLPEGCSPGWTWVQGDTRGEAEDIYSLLRGIRI